MKKSRTRLDAWASAQKRFHLSDLHIQMARELGLNPKKFGGLANHRQEPWKLSLPEFIAELPETVPPRATGEGGPPHRGREAAPAIGSDTAKHPRERTDT